MHKVYENNDLMMYFKKRHCHCCGGVLRRKRTEKVVKKGDPEHKVYCSIGSSYKPHGDILVIGTEYYCPFCNKTFSCDEQGKIIEAQKYYGKRIVSQEEILRVENNSEASSGIKILKFRWLLLLPILGGLICMFYIFNGKLSEKTNSKDGVKLLLFSTLAFLGVALVIKIVLSLFGSVDFMDKYNTLIMLVPSLLSFNLPTLLYINRKFK